MGMIYAALQNFQPVDFCRLLARNGRLAPVPVFHDLSRRKRIVLHADLLPGGMFV
jgi:hypothetical protein